MAGQAVWGGLTKAGLLGVGCLLAATTPARTAAAQPVTVPVDVGVGPAVYLISGRVAEDQLHLGLKISVQAIVDQQTLRAHPERIPANLRRQALRLKEVRISPSFLIPDALIISPKVRNTGLYGVTWRPLSIGVPLIGEGGVRLQLGAGLLLTYAYLVSELPDLPTTHFLRPGIDAGAELEIAAGPSFLISVGWSSAFYVPQRLGSFAVGQLDGPEGLEQTLWHFGQAFLKLHFRFPYTVRL
jgi:hypothetical protein